MAGCGEMIGIGRRRPVTDRGMWPGGVVVGEPGSDDLPSLIEIENGSGSEVTDWIVDGFEVASSPHHGIDMGCYPASSPPYIYSRSPSGHYLWLSSMA